jgi:hypothetical protein
MQPDLEDLDQEIMQVRREKDTAAGRQDYEAAAALRDKEKQLLVARTAREQEWTEAAASRLPLAGEFGRMSAELDRLRATLREHGIDPGDGAA